MKMKELRALSDTDLQNRLNDFKRELLNLRIQQQSAQLEKPSRFREIRRTIAQIQTLLSEKRLKREAVTS